MFNLVKTFYNKPLPVWNAPAVNNAYIASLSKPPVGLEGAGGHINRGAWQVREPTQFVISQAALINGFNGMGQPVFSTFGSQPLVTLNNYNR